MLDVCWGDSLILDYISEYIDDYLGVDNNEEYLKKCKEHWKKFNFINLDLNHKKNVMKIGGWCLGFMNEKWADKIKHLLDEFTMVCEVVKNFGNSIHNIYVIYGTSL